MLGMPIMAHVKVNLNVNVRVARTYSGRSDGGGVWIPRRVQALQWALAPWKSDIDTGAQTVRITVCCQLTYSTEYAEPGNANHDSHGAQ